MFTSLDSRIALLEKLLANYKERKEEMANAIAQEMGAPISLAKSAQVNAGTSHLQAFIDLGKDFSFEKQLGTEVVIQEAVGVVAAITPWNWYVIVSLEESTRARESLHILISITLISF